MFLSEQPGKNGAIWLGFKFPDSILPGKPCSRFKVLAAQNGSHAVIRGRTQVPDMCQM